MLCVDIITTRKKHRHLKKAQQKCVAKIEKKKTNKYTQININRNYFKIILIIITMRDSREIQPINKN